MNFVDREVQFPGRVKLTAVNGQSSVYDVTREEGTVTNAGTELNAATLNNAFAEKMDKFEPGSGLQMLSDSTGKTLVVKDYAAILSRIADLESVMETLEARVYNLEQANDDGEQILFNLFLSHTTDTRVWIQNCQAIRDLIYSGQIFAINLVNQENVNFSINVGDSGNGIVVTCGDSVGGSSESGSYYNMPFIVLPCDIHITDITVSSGEIAGSIKEIILSNLTTVFGGCGERIM